MDQQKPEAGGYVVQHDGDRWSYSTEAAFEGGFTLADGG